MRCTEGLVHPCLATGLRGGFCMLMVFEACTEVSACPWVRHSLHYPSLKCLTTLLLSSVLSIPVPLSAKRKQASRVKNTYIDKKEAHSSLQQSTPLLHSLALLICSLPIVLVVCSLFKWKLKQEGSHPYLRHFAQSYCCQQFDTRLHYPCLEEQDLFKKKECLLSL